MSTQTDSPDELLSQTKGLLERERQTTIEILHHLWEIDRRRIYAKLGYPSLWEYAVKELKYSEIAAYQRISAMRAMKWNPALEEKMKSGQLSLAAVTQVHSFLKSEQDRANRTYTREQKAEIFKRCENKGSKEVTRELLEISPLAIRVQKESAVTENRTMISFLADSELLTKLRRVRDLSVPRLKDPASYPELMDLMSEVALDKLDPLRKEARVREKPSLKETRAITPGVRAKIWREFEGKCSYTDPKTGNRCNSTFGLEIEHCKPYAMGGSSRDASNLRLLCRKHNQLQAIESYGLEKMEKYLG